MLVKRPIARSWARPAAAARSQRLVPPISAVNNYLLPPFARTDVLCSSHRKQQQHRQGDLNRRTPSTTRTVCVLLASPSPSACAPRAQRDTTGRWQWRALRSCGPEVSGGCLTQRPRLALVRPHRGRSATRKQRDLPKTWLGFPLCSLVLPAAGWATRGLPAPRSSQQPPRRFRGAGRALFTRRQTTNLPRWTR